MSEKGGGLFSRFRDGLKKTRKALGLGRIFGGSRLDEDLLEELEENLITADLGPAFAVNLIEELREASEDGTIESDEQAMKWLHERLSKDLKVPKRQKPESNNKLSVWFFLGVNGVGKTTSLGKLAKRLKDNRFSVLLAACDTFRAAAGEQLSLWAERTGCEVVRHKEGGDPSAVLFDALEAAEARNCDYLLVDTAGRLHNKKNLMAELEKMFRVMDRKGYPPPDEVFLVVDAGTGHNAVQQAKLFHEIAPLSGLILTKLDGTAKGGVAFQLTREVELPIRYVGIGEKAEDLVDFDAESFLNAILEPVDK